MGQIFFLYRGGGGLRVTESALKLSLARGREIFLVVYLEDVWSVSAGSYKNLSRPAVGLEYFLGLALKNYIHILDFHTFCY